MFRRPWVGKNTPVASARNSSRWLDRASLLTPRVFRFLASIASVSGLCLHTALALAIANDDYPAAQLTRGMLRARTGMFIRRLVLLVAICSLLSGCALPWHAPQGPVVNAVDNPLFVPTTDREFLWNTLVDTVDDYFKVNHEERVRLVGGILTEGRLDTVPTPGSTYLEPWRGDSTPGYEKLHASLQSIRRQASARVIPTPGGYLIEIVVNKELEDLDRPEQSTAGTSYQRHDGTIVRIPNPAQGAGNTLGWIPLGRDVSLEQTILLQLRAKLSKTGNVTTPLPLDVNQGAYIDSE